MDSERDMIRVENKKIVIDPPQADLVKSAGQPYRVIYFIDVHALNPIAAAEEAADCMRNGDRPVLEVFDSKLGRTTIDLMEREVVE